MTRGSVSKTLPEVCAYDVDPGGPKPAATGPAARNTGVVRRGKSSSAAPIRPRPATRLLQEPSTVRRPKESSGLGSWLGPVPISAPHGPVADVVFATWASATLICLRMYERSDGVIVNP